MRRAERLFRLVSELRARGVCLAEDLADYFEISVRTIYRDIAHLQASGLPIEGEAGVGYLLRPGFDLPAMTFTFEQLDALAVGLSFVEVAGDSSLAEAAREVRAKIQASLPDPDARKLERAPLFASRRDGPANPIMKVVRRAIRRRTTLHLHYENGEGSLSNRRVRPLAIWAFTEGWLFAGWCELRDDFRAFRLDRINALEETGDRFADDPDRNLDAYLRARILAPQKHDRASQNR
ncbi:helix-turn-helix transcriptional regulator [Qipengyuania qiaonensis]|uniref:YafY family transcriptional regulator n=1 Tax=Qipengyuania qiaonensis TaxID=2867240 RepID=A0ABS7J7U7_9SPHN|nr:YafY family protein [Qipengyuania qiaonensis]MBX7482040.1 YafY family transcriptional regulator [Qipengyuania qiaonensis]